MTDILLQLTLLTILVSLASYRLTRLVVEDDITAGWRQRHGIGVNGFRCGDTWSALWPECEEDKVIEEYSSEQPYRVAVRSAGEKPWPVSWIVLLMDVRFWKRAFSCPQCGSVWICGALAAVAAGVAALATGDPAWLAGWLVVAPASAGLTSWIL